MKLADSDFYYRILRISLIVLILSTDININTSYPRHQAHD